MTTDNSSNIAIVMRMATGLALFILVAGCSPSPEGDGSVSGGVSGLEMATTMSVVTPTGGFTGSSAPMNQPNLTASDIKDIIAKVISGQVFDPESDYEKDKARISVEDDSNSSLEFVNILLCFVAQTRMADLVNTGAYTAFLNPTECIPGLDDVGFFRAVVESKRAFEHSPQYVNVWVPFADFLGSDWGGGLVLETVIYSEASTTDPFGQFELKMSLNVTAPVGESFGIPPLVMNTRTVQRSDGKVEFISFFESGDPFMQEFDNYSLGSANVVMDDAQGNSGASVSFSRDLKIRCVDVDNITPIDPCVIDTTQDGYEVVYNSTHLYRRDTGLLSPTPAEACFDRINPFYEVNNYGAYYEQDGVVNGTPVTAGQRVATDIRYGFEYSGQVGWADSYGIRWYSGDNTILMPDGATITRTGTVSQDYVVHRSEGGLSRYTGRTVAVANVPGAVFSYDGNYSGTPASIATWDLAGRYPADFGFNSWRVAVNPTTFNFEIVGGLTQDPVTNDNVLSPTAVPAAIINQPVDSNGVTIPSSTLRLSAFYTSMEYDDSLYASPAVGNLTYRGKYERVFPWHSDLYTAATQTGSTSTLYCYNNCMIGGIFAPAPVTTLTYPGFNTAAPSAGSIAAAVDIPVVTEGGLRTYDLITDGKKYRLIDNTNMMEVALLDTSAVTFTSRSMYGLRDTQIPPISMFHPTLNPGGTINANNLPELKLNETEYTWDTGTRDYNKVYTASKNTAADPVETFNELIQFLYKHDIADDINDALNLAQVESWDNLLTVLDTYDGDIYPYFPRFDWPYTSSQNWGVNSANMTKGVVLTDFNGTNYVIKPLDIDQLLIEYELAPGMPDTAPCTAVLDPDRAKNELQLPTVDSVKPMIIDFSDIPIPVNTPPKVIDGEIL